MKDSKKYSDNLEKFWRKFKPKGKIEKPQFSDPVEAMVYANVLNSLGTGKADRYIKRLRDNFVDWNDLRVSRNEEIMEALGGESGETKDLAVTLRNCLQAVFEKNDCLELDYILELGKRKANEELKDLKVLPAFVESYIMLVCLDGHSIPTNEKTADFMKENDLADSKAGIDEVQSFVERQIPAANNYEFFVTMQELSEKGIEVSTPKKKTSKTTKKVAKKTVKKKTTKKKTSKK